MSGLFQQRNGEAMTQGLTLSRRAVCAGGVFVAALPFGVMAKSEPAPLSAPLHLRGVTLGQRAILRTAGTVSLETTTGTARSWNFDEATDVSWSMVEGQVVEHRSGQMRLNGRVISTGPVAEVLCSDQRLATIAITRGATSLLVAATSLSPSSVWDIIDDPNGATLPHGLSEYRVFRTTQDENVRNVYWTLRSPWLAALGDAPPNTRVIWRGQGQLVGSRDLV